MRADVPELLFPGREDFRAWLSEHAKTSDGVWLVFGKAKSLVTLSANDALEEALCFGWIDGQMKRIDDVTYLKYFARRRGRSPWSEKNKKTVDMLREKRLMTDLGEKAVESAKRNGLWDVEREPITDEMVEILAEKLSGLLPAYENFIKMPPSARRTLTRRHFSFKSEEARQRDFFKIVDMLHQM